MSFQGFDRKLNLSENTEDRDVLNNVGISPIADDIALFLNNLRDVSSLSITTDKRIGTTIRFDETIQRAVFTNGTEIQVFAGTTLIGTYYVGNSNNVNEFQIFSDVELTQLAFPPAGADVKYVRSDAVTKENVLNLVKPRDPVVENPTISQITYGSAYEDDVARNPYTSLRKVFSRIRSSSNTLGAYITEIESELDVFQQKSDNSMLSESEFTTSEKLIVTGSILITDPNDANIGNQSLTTSGPGVFILDAATGEAKRAFSDNTNVWEDDGTNLVVDAKDLVIGNLVFDDGVRITRKASLPAIATETALATTFTHYITINVNGEEYSLCLK